MKTKLVNAYNGLADFTPFHRLLIRIYIFYLFLIPGVSMFAHDQFFGPAKGQTLAVFMILTAIHLGFVVNNFRVPSSVLGTILLVVRLPLEILIFSLIQDWSLMMALASLYSFEVIGMSIGLMIGAIFRKAKISVGQRIASIVIAWLFSLCAVYRFEGMFEAFFGLYTNPWVGRAVVLVPIATATYPYSRMFINGKDDKGLNMGTSPLTSKLGPYIGLAVLINLILMILGINL